MIYENSYLENFSRALRGDLEALRKLVDPNEIHKMFLRDCEKLKDLFEKNAAKKEEVVNAFNLLKAYVISQLSIHFEKAKKIAESKGIKAGKLDLEKINEIALMIDEFEKKL